ncbi:MAG: winged helix-turn-helix transcriptional regulator [Anaerolinea sp.]|nr:winged helix-turn-helix transcriptional regulator [Anaerolinea sp.]
MTIINIQFAPAEFSDLRFAFAPLLETTTSYALLKKNDESAVHYRWSEETRRALHGLEFPFMDALIPPHRYIADFVTPTPNAPVRSLHDEFERLRATPVSTIHANVQYLIALHGESEHRRYYLAYPHESVECLIEELSLYWKRALQPHWDRITQRLEGDILLHARKMALHGTPAMLNDLTDTVSYQDEHLMLQKSECVHQQTEYALDGRGLVLAPTVFKYACGVSWQIVPEYTPMVIYGAHGSGLWHGEPLPNPEKELVLAFGDARARVLLAVQTPAPTSELARRLHMTSGAVSQQLKRLRGAGLVSTQRQGYFVYYALTERGQKLIDLFAG